MHGKVAFESIELSKNFDAANPLSLAQNVISQESAYLDDLQGATFQISGGAKLQINLQDTWLLSGPYNSREMAEFYFIHADGLMSWKELAGSMAQNQHTSRLSFKSRPLLKLHEADAYAQECLMHETYESAYFASFIWNDLQQMTWRPWLDDYKWSSCLGQSFKRQQGSANNHSKSLEYSQWLLYLSEGTGILLGASFWLAEGGGQDQFLQELQAAPQWHRRSLHPCSLTRP